MKRFSRKELKKKIFSIIQIGDKSNFVSRFFDKFIITAILLNITVMFLQTFNELEKYYFLFKCIEVITTLIFIVEYLLRIWTADLLYEKKHHRLRYMTSFDGIVDLLTIIPMYFLDGFVVFRMLRIVRILRLFRINNKYDSFNVITSVLYEKRNQLLSSIFIILMLMFASSLCMYSVENKVQPDVFENAFSGLWWSVSTILTVGYGDIFPITVMGKLMAIIIAFLGVMVVALPTGIISAGFVEQYSKDSESDVIVDVKDIAEIKISKFSKYLGKTVKELYEINSLKVFVIIRGKNTIMATPDASIEENDIVVLQSIQKGKKGKSK